MGEKETLSILEHYIQSLLADPDYDPPVSTLHHLEKMLAIVKAVDAPYINPQDSAYITIDLHDRGISIVGSRIDGTALVLPGGPATVKKLRTTQSLEQGFLTGTYEALMFYKAFATPDQKQRQNLVVRHCIEEFKSCHSMSQLLDNSKLPKEKVDIVKDFRYNDELFITKCVFLEWYPPRSTDDLKQAYRILLDTEWPI